MTGWTVENTYLLDMLLEPIRMSIVIIGEKTSLHAGNSPKRNQLLINKRNIVPFMFKIVKTLVTRGQSAWINSINSSEAIREVSTKKDSEFEQWLTGVTDGDGTFHFTQSNGKWVFYFKISQSFYNLRLLYYIKKKLGVGEISISKNMAEYRIRDRKKLLQYIIPIFEENKLLTSKYYNYELFKKALFIATDISLNNHLKQEKITIYKEMIRPIGYISPVFSQVGNKINNLEDAKLIMTKSWLIGFTEAEGSFYLFHKDKNRISHGFEITQKDKIVLDAAAQLLNVKVKTKKTYFTVYADTIKEISNIIIFYHNTMKGIKSLEYRIWARSFNKKGNEKYMYLSKVLLQMRNIRSIRLDKNKG